MRKFIRAMAMSVGLALATALPAGAVTNSIQSVSPVTLSPGTTNLLVYFNLATTPSPPDTNIAPNLAMVGTNTGTTLTHTNRYIVTARFTMPVDEAPGAKDALVRFPGPSNGVYYIKTGAFTVQSTQVVYVAAANTNGPWNGQSWVTAFRSLKDALPGAMGSVWVAQGVYTPGSDRTASFALVPGVALYGGFAGNETNLSQRNWAAHPTVLSGDLGMPGATGDNAYHVLIGANNAVLDGFVVADGNADGRTYNGFGGGMVSYDGASATVLNCTFRGNRAREGGAIYNYNDCLPLIAGCTFASNTANKGGAMVNRDGSNATISNCLFAANTAAWRGGAVFNDYGASPVLMGCTFTNNTTPGHGGAIYTDDTASQIGFTSPLVTNCVFLANAAAYRGGAIGNYNKCTATIRNCAFTNNAAGTGGGAIANDYGVTTTISGSSYSGNTGGTGQANVDTDATSVVQ